MMSVHMHQLSHRSRIKSKPLLRDHRQKTGAGFVVRIIELFVALVLLEVFLILLGKKGALMMVEPPGNFGRTGIFEVHNGVFIAIEVSLVEIERPRGAVSR